MYKNPSGLLLFDMPARPTAGIGVVEVQKLEDFCVFAVRG